MFDYTPDSHGYRIELATARVRAFKAITAVFGIAMITAIIVLGFTGCTWFTSHETAIAEDAAKLLGCVLQHETEGAVQIAAACATDVATATNLLDQHRAAVKREALAMATANRQLDAGR